MSRKSDAAEASAAEVAAQQDSDARLAQAEQEVYGNDPLKERGIGSRYQSAPPAVKAHLHIAETLPVIEQMIALANQLMDAAQRVLASHKQAVEHAAAAKNAPPPPPQEPPQPPVVS